MKKITYLYILLTLSVFAYDECAYFANQIGVYKNNILTVRLRNRGLNSTEKLIDTYQYNLKREILKRDLTFYLDNLVRIDAERYQDISPFCVYLKRLSKVKKRKEAFNIKREFFKKILCFANDIIRIA